MIGTATSRTAPHQKCSTSQPPTIGPRAAPPEKPAAQIATASRRRLGSGKMLRIRDSVDGISMAPKRPSPARPAISHSGLGANAVAAETAANPRCRRRAAGAGRSCRPGCPSQPAVRQGPGDRHRRSTAARRRRRPGCGRWPAARNVSAVLSTATSRTGNISRASASQSRHGARGPVATGVLVAAVIDGVLIGRNYTVWTVQLRNPRPDGHDGRHAQETRRPRGRSRCLRIPADRSRVNAPRRWMPSRAGPESPRAACSTTSLTRRR